MGGAAAEGIYGQISDTAITISSSVKGEADRGGEAEGRENEERQTSENVQTGRVESHRWLDTHRRSIMKLWRRQRLLGVSRQELGL